MELSLGPCMNLISIKRWGEGLWKLFQSGGEGCKALDTAKLIKITVPKFTGILFL